MRTVGGSSARDQTTRSRTRSTRTPAEPRSRRAAAPSTNGHSARAARDARRRPRRIERDDRAVRERERRPPSTSPLIRRGAGCAGAGVQRHQACASDLRKRFSCCTDSNVCSNRLRRGCAGSCRSRASPSSRRTRSARRASARATRDRATGFARCRSGNSVWLTCRLVGCSGLPARRGLAISTPIFANARFASSPERSIARLHEAQVRAAVARLVARDQLVDALDHRLGVPLGRAAVPVIEADLAAEVQHQRLERAAPDRTRSAPRAAHPRSARAPGRKRRRYSISTSACFCSS